MPSITRPISRLKSWASVYGASGVLLGLIVFGGASGAGIFEEGINPIRVAITVALFTALYGVVLSILASVVVLAVRRRAWWSGSSDDFVATVAAAALTACVGCALLIVTGAASAVGVLLVLLITTGSIVLGWIAARLAS